MSNGPPGGDRGECYGLSESGASISGVGKLAHPLPSTMSAAIAIPMTFAGWGIWSSRLGVWRRVKDPSQ